MRAMMFVVAFSFLAMALRAEAQTHPGHALDSGAVILRSTEVQPALAALWDCPTMHDEFAERRCEAGLASSRAFARETVFVGSGVAHVGRYDFDAHRFPIDIAGVVANEPDAAWSSERDGEAREPWDVNGHMAIGPSALRAETAGRVSGLPADWAAAAHGEVQFPDDASAEAWRGQLAPPSDDDAGFEGPALGALLIFRVVRTWRVREAPSVLSRILHRRLAHELGPAGTRLPPPAGETYDGVQIRVLGWALLGPRPDGSGGPDIIATGVTARRRAERETTQATLDLLAARFRDADGTIRPDTSAATTPTPTTTSPELSELSEAQISEVRRHEQRGLQTCWETATRGMDEVSEVHMDIDMVIGASGAVTRARTRGTGPPLLADCIEQRVRRWHFPPSREPTQLTFPVLFSGSTGHTSEGATTP